MAKRYKLTNQDMTTYNDCKWEVGKWKKTSGEGELCTQGWMHCYDSPLLAILHNPIHADIANPRLWEVECRGKTKNDKGMKRGYSKMRLIKELPLPKITTINWVKYGILCALEVYHDEDFVSWANAWLSGKNRSKAAARDAWSARAATIAAWDDAEAAAWWDTARAVEWAVEWAAARAAWSARAATIAAWNAESAGCAARHSAGAAEWATLTAMGVKKGKINLVKIARQACN